MDGNLSDIPLVTRIQVVASNISKPQSEENYRVVILSCPSFSIIQQEDQISMRLTSEVKNPAIQMTWLSFDLKTLSAFNRSPLEGVWLVWA